MVLAGVKGWCRGFYLDLDLQFNGCVLGLNLKRLYAYSLDFGLDLDLDLDSYVLVLDLKGKRVGLSLRGLGQWPWFGLKRRRLGFVLALDSQVIGL